MAATDTILIEVRENGSRVVSRALMGIAGSAEKAETALDRLQRQMVTLRRSMHLIIASLALRQLRDYIDTWIAIENNIKLSTKTTAEAAEVQRRLFQVAQETRAPMEDVVRLYRRTAQAAEMVGASQEDMIQVMRGVGMALVVQGTTAIDARGALLQLGQAFGMARVRAQEFNAINENTPRILQAIADNTKGANGNIQQLRQLILQGKISGKEFFEAFKRGLPKLREEFAKATPTIGQAMTVFSNAFGLYIREIDKSIGLSRTFSKILIAVAFNLDIVGKALLSVAAAFVLANWRVFLGLLARVLVAVRAITVALMTNPLYWVGAAIASLTLFRDEIVLVQKDSITLGDYMRAIWAGMSGYVDKVVQAFKKVDQQVVKGESSILGYLKNIGQAWLRFVKGLVNSWIGIFVFLYEAVKIIFTQLPNVIQDAAISGMNKFRSYMENTINDIIDKINILRAILGKELIPNIVIPPITNEQQGAIIKFGEAFKDAFKSSFVDYVGKALDATFAWLDKLTAKAREIAKARQAVEGDTDLTKKPPTRPAVDVQSNEKLIRELERIQNVADPIGAALREIDQAQRDMEEGVRKGLITYPQYVQWLNALNLELKAQYDPQARFLRSLMEVTRALEVGLLPLEEYARQVANLRLQFGQGTFADAFIDELGLLDIHITNWTARIGTEFGNLTNGIIDGFADATARMMFFGESFKEAFGNAARQALANMVSGLIKIGAQMIINKAVGQSLMAGATEATIAAASASAMAWSTPAALASLATLGTNAAAATAAMTEAVAVAKMLAIGGGMVPSYDEGGFTGWSGRRRIAGLVHGQEFVVNAEATSRNRGLLESINRGESPSSPVNIYVENYGSSRVDVEKINETDIRVIVKDELVRETDGIVASSIVNPNSRTSKALGRHTSVLRRR